MNGELKHPRAAGDVHSEEKTTENYSVFIFAYVQNFTADV